MKTSKKPLFIPTKKKIKDIASMKQEQDNIKKRTHHTNGY